MGVRYSSNFTPSRLNPGVDAFAMLFAITSIDRYAASCCERLTSKVLSTAKALSGPSLAEVICTAYAMHQIQRLPEIL